MIDWTARLTVHQEMEIENRIERLILDGYIPEEARHSAIQVLAERKVKEIEASR